MEEFGAEIPDPDAVIVDIEGIVATSGPDSVLVGGIRGGVGRITQIGPDGITSVLFESSGPELGNPNQLAFDSSGRLLFANVSPGTVGIIDSDVLRIFAECPGEELLGIAIHQNNRVFVCDRDGTIKLFDSDGNLLNSTFVSGLSEPRSMAFDIEGLFGGGLFVVDWETGTIVRIDPATGGTTQFATDLDAPQGLMFGPDGCLFVSEFDTDTVWRIFRENSPPVAVCQDVTLSADEYCQADVTPEQVGNGSYDPDGDPITLSLDPLGPYPLGDTLVTLTVTDDKGASDQCTATVTVVDADPPTIVLSEPYPFVLWPANHKFVDVMIMGMALDNCDADLAIDVSVELLDVEGGDGGLKHDPDFEIIRAAIDDDGNIEIMVSLRAERSGKGNGRAYVITVTVTDASGNATPGVVQVIVPHDQGQSKKK